jgi:chromosome segregation protein
VTRTGEWIDRRGLVLAGVARGGSERASLLDRANQIRDLHKQRADGLTRLETLRLQATQLQGKIDALDQHIEELRRRDAEIAEELATLASQEQTARRGSEQNRSLRQTRATDLGRLEHDRDASTARLGKAQADLQAMEAAMQRQRQAIAAAEQRVAALQAEREDKRERFNEIRMEVASKRQQLEMLGRGLADLEKQSREIEVTCARRAEELENIGRQSGEAAAEQAAQQERLAILERELAGVMQALEGDRAALQAVDTAIQQVEAGFAGKRERHDQLLRSVNQHDVQLARLQSQQQFIGEELARAYQVEPAAIDWRSELWQAGEALPERIRVDIEEEAPEDFTVADSRPDPGPEDLAALAAPDWDAVRDEVENLRGRLQAIGEVNLLAIEEYKELRTRHAFYKEQSDDLWKAKEQLLQAIDEINSTSRQLFTDTFAKIRENFQYTFKTLFGGGGADLSLVDEGDVLESGIDIAARPPGTRLRSLALLSGGQKTMTAVALLFAIYMVKPSPFCVLDEIDAPLDDVNIGRFTDMLEQFLQYSQFLIITHNKRTISVADEIYGATMQERGVTRMISMRFNKATGRTEEAAAEPVES